MDPAFLPSQISLDGLLPLVGTLGRAEREFAATLLVRVSQAKGDQWQFVSPRTIGEVMNADLKAGNQPLERLSRNPFVPFPDFRDLVNSGFAEFEARRAGYEYEGDPSVRLTEKGLRGLRRWLSKPCPKCARPSPCLWWTSEPGLHCWDKGVGPIAGGWLARQNHTPKTIDDSDFNHTAWKDCREIFICRHHGEFGLIDGGGLPFFYEPDAYVLGPGGEKLFRM